MVTAQTTCVHLLEIIHFIGTENWISKNKLLLCVSVGYEDAVDSCGRSASSWSHRAVYQPLSQQAMCSANLWGERTASTHEARLHASRPTLYEDDTQHLATRRTHQDHVHCKCCCLHQDHKTSSQRPSSQNPIFLFTKSDFLIYKYMIFEF